MGFYECMHGPSKFWRTARILAQHSKPRTPNALWLASQSSQSQSQQSQQNATDIQTEMVDHQEECIGH